MNEFYRRGDYEKNNGEEVSFNCNRETDQIHKVQIDFIEKIVEPSFKVLIELLERYDEANNLELNIV